MSQVTVTETSLENIADAIRAKLGVQTEYKPGEMAAAIQSIPTLTATVEGSTLILTGSAVNVQNNTLVIGG